jgi:hypothetical protein
MRASRLRVLCSLTHNVSRGSCWLQLVAHDVPNRLERIDAVAENRYGGRVFEGDSRQVLVLAAGRIGSPLPDSLPTAGAQRAFLRLWAVRLAPS